MSELTGEMTVLLKRRRIGDPLVFVRLPTAAVPCERSSALDAKFADRVDWMQTRGIRIGLNVSECPQLVKRLPLPGTVIPFSSKPSIEI